MFLNLFSMFIILIESSLSLTSKTMIFILPFFTYIAIKQNLTKYFYMFLVYVIFASQSSYWLFYGIILFIYFIILNLAEINLHNVIIKFIIKIILQLFIYFIFIHFDVNIYYLIIHIFAFLVLNYLYNFYFNED